MAVALSSPSFPTISLGRTAPARDVLAGNATAGLGLKPEHYADAIDSTADGLWFEVHAENYMTAGGPRLAWLEAFRSRYPLSLHGVGLSLAADADPDAEHLARLRSLVERYEPFVVSEHLAWSSWKGVYHPDLLPFPRTEQALARVTRNVLQTQDSLKRRILIENPTHYLTIDGHQYAEIEFLSELSRRTGCGLLLDVNNVWVSANNIGFDSQAYIDAFPAAAIGEIHLAGHRPDAVHPALLIDSHDAPIDVAVWRLYERLIARIGARPTLIERDGDLPSFSQLLVERDRAHGVLRAGVLSR
jgi:uncharacterized protein